MHAVQPPQPRHVMKRDVLAVDHEIEHEEAKQGGEREPQSEDVKEAEAVAGGQERDADRRGRDEQSHQQGVDHEDSEIAGPAHDPADAEPPPRRQHFPHGHDREDANKGGETDGKLRGDGHDKSRRETCRL